MKTQQCININCKRFQDKGKFCLDCGSVLKDYVSVGVKFNRVKSKQYIPGIRNNIVKYLGRIGVKEKDIQIINNEEDGSAQVLYILLGKKYVFSSSKQNSLTNNLYAIQTFLHARVVGIERGIEIPEQAFAGYLELEGTIAYEYQTESQLKELLKKHHPDTGDGNIEELTKIKKALEKIKMI